MPINKWLVKLVIYAHNGILLCVALKKDEEVLYRYGKIYKIYKRKKTRFRIVHRACYHLC